jgi:hypothetical protein
MDFAAFTPIGTKNKQLIGQKVPSYARQGPVKGGLHLMLVVPLVKNWFCMSHVINISDTFLY